MTELTLEKEVSSRCFPLSSSKASYHSRGRYALVVALRLIDPARRGRVLLPSYICRSVTDTLNRYGYLYSYYPVTRKAEPMFDALRSLLGEDVSSLLFVNYFGFPQPVERLVDICRERGIVLIEDNAHGFLGRDEDGKPLGGRGDIGIFSFPKTVYVPDGGAMVVNSGDLPNWSAGVTSSDTAPGIHGAFFLKRGVLKALESMGIDSRIVGRLRWEKRGGEERPVEVDWRMSEVTKHLLEKVEPGAVAGYRRENYREVVWICGSMGLETLYPDPGTSVCPYLVPVVAGPTDGMRKHAESILRNKGWKVSHWPDLPPSLDRQRYIDAWWLRENIMAVYLRPAVV